MLNEFFIAFVIASVLWGVGSVLDGTVYAVRATEHAVVRVYRKARSALKHAPPPPATPRIDCAQTDGCVVRT